MRVQHETHTWPTNVRKERMKKSAERLLESVFFIQQFSQFCATERRSFGLRSEKNFATLLNSKEKEINSLRCFFNLWELSHHSSRNSLSQVVGLSRFHLHTSRRSEEKTENKLEKFHNIG